jgi:hypothetical protein
MFPKQAPAPKMSKTKAVNEYCKGCIYDKLVPGTWREQVENCTSQHCPLWQHRPMTMATVTLHRKTRGADGLNLDALVDGLEDDDEVSVEV